QAWEAMPEISEISDNLIVEATDEGLDIQIVDQRGRPMFQEGSKYPYEWMRAAIAAIAPTLERLPNQIRISGHTAAGVVYSNPEYGAWELSADRANTVRSILGEFGLSDERIYSVVGRATSEPFFVNDPYLAANERIRITVINEPSPVPLNLAPSTAAWPCLWRRFIGLAAEPTPQGTMALALARYWPAAPPAIGPGLATTPARTQNVHISRLYAQVLEN